MLKNCNSKRSLWNKVKARGYQAFSIYLSVGPHLVYVGALVGVWYLLSEVIGLYSFTSTDGLLVYVGSLLGISALNYLLGYLSMVTFQWRFTRRAARKEKVAVIGAGLGGIEMAHQLLIKGFKPTVFDRSDGFGGTWKVNGYPGCKSDIETTGYLLSHWFSFYRASHFIFHGYSERDMMARYADSMASYMGLHGFTRFRTTVKRIQFDANNKRYQIEYTMANGRTQAEDFDYVICAIGTLADPNVLMEENDAVCHASRMNPFFNESLRGKEVALVGAGCSGSQMVHQLVYKYGVKRLHIICTRGMFFASGLIIENILKSIVDTLLVVLPFGTRFLRLFVRIIGQKLLCDATIFDRGFFKWIVVGYTRAIYKSLGLAHLVPTRSMVTTRTIIDYDFFSTIAAHQMSGKVRVVTARVFHSTPAPDGGMDLTLVLQTPGDVGNEALHVDKVILATGFKTDYSERINRMGIDWDRSASFFGLTLKGHNTGRLFFMYGPNTNTACQPITHMLELQAKTIVRMMCRGISPTDEDCDDFQKWCDNATNPEMASADSWYTCGTGRNICNFPGMYQEYDKRLGKALRKCAQA